MCEIFKYIFSHFLLYMHTLIYWRWADCVYVTISTILLCVKDTVSICNTYFRNFLNFVHYICNIMGIYKVLIVEEMCRHSGTGRSSTNAWIINLLICLLQLDKYMADIIISHSSRTKCGIYTHAILWSPHGLILLC